MKTDKYDDSNPFLWLFILGYFVFWFMVWAEERPTKLKPLKPRHATTSHYGR